MAETKHLSAKALLAVPALQALTLSGFALSFLGSGFRVVFTLFCYTPVDKGGLVKLPSALVPNVFNSPRPLANFLHLLVQSLSSSGLSHCPTFYADSTMPRRTVRTVRVCIFGPSSLQSYPCLMHWHVPIPCILGRPLGLQRQQRRVTSGSASLSFSGCLRSQPSHILLLCSSSNDTLFL